MTATGADRRWVGFMSSHPNVIPLGAADAEEAVRRSAERYLDRIGG